MRTARTHRIRLSTRAMALTAVAVLALLPAPATAAERTLTLAEAILQGLKKNEGIVIERESLAAAQAGMTGARGAYDPLLEVNGDWTRTTAPVNSAFSGAPSGQSAPTNRSALRWRCGRYRVRNRPACAACRSEGPGPGGSRHSLAAAWSATAAG